MENPIVILNSKRYLMIEAVFNTLKSAKEIEFRIQKYEGIYQGIKEVKQVGFFSKGYIIIRVLIPETKIEEYRKESFIQ